jgi:hypothetical protein
MARSGDDRRPEAQALLGQMLIAHGRAATAFAKVKEAFAAVQAVHAEGSDSTAVRAALHAGSDEVRAAAAEVSRLGAELRALHAAERAVRLAAREPADHRCTDRGR